MSKEKILIVEDDEAIRELVAYNLKLNNFDSVHTARDGEEGLKMALQLRPDLILLDLMLPGIDGLTVCRELRKREETAAIPIIMLTARSEESDILVGLELGANDYITKPFSTKILLARIRVQLRQQSNTSGTTELHRGGWIINRETRSVRCDGEELSLTFGEFEILYLLASHPGRVYTRNQIVNKIKGDDYPVTERAIDVQIVGLRKKLGDGAAMIETIRGVGYRFKQDFEELS